MEAGNLTLEQIGTLSRKDLIKLALTDFDRVAGDDRYEIDMAYWHEAEEPTKDIVGPSGFVHRSDAIKCRVCFAGAVLAGRVPRSVTVGDPPAHHWMLALDRFRTEVDMDMPDQYDDGMHQKWMEHAWGLWLWRYGDRGAYVDDVPEQYRSADA